MTSPRRVRYAAAIVIALAAGSALAAATNWTALTAAQQQALAPLQKDWPTLGPDRRQKWLEIASRFPSMPEAERQRVQARMAEWARMTPAERALARQQFQEVRQIPATERQERWRAYQALPDAERKKLAQNAKPVSKSASAPETGVRLHAEAGAAKHAAPAATPTAPPGRSSPTIVVQVKPGATTTPLSTRAPLPSHNQPGVPKIAATPGYVDPATLLPKRGPQGAAVRAAASSAPVAEQP